ncbi:MAG: DUF3341 domain-containing protein [Planctomycetes bacterium]|jgi:hypothetical protein|nr:DUF3341 domain-containing protein [Planctomycetota bacterium]
MSEHVSHNPTDAAPQAYGLLAEFDNVDALLHAARGVRRAGYGMWDCFTPFPVHGLNRVMGLRPTLLPYIVLACGIAGAVIGIAGQFYVHATEFDGLPSFVQGYKIIFSGKPYASGPAFIPVTFEMTILLAAFGSFVGMLLLNGLPRLYHPAFRSERFRRVTNDRFFIAIEADDPLYDCDQARRLLEELGATHVEQLQA